MERQPRWRLRQVSDYALAQLSGHLSRRITCNMDVTLSGLRTLVPENGTDQWQRGSVCSCKRCGRMTKIVKAHITQPRPFPDHLPNVLQVRVGSVLRLTSNNKDRANRRHPPQTMQDVQRPVIEVNAALSAFGRREI